MHRDEPICRARTPLRGLPHILQSMSRSCRASWRCDWQVPTPGSAGWAGEVHSGKLTPVCHSDGGWGFEGKCRCCPLSDLRRHGAYWSLVSVSSKSDSQPITCRWAGHDSLRKTLMIDIEQYCFAQNFTIRKYYVPTPVREQSFQSISLLDTLMFGSVDKLTMTSLAPFVNLDLDIFFMVDLS